MVVMKQIIITILRDSIVFQIFFSFSTAFRAPLAASPSSTHLDAADETQE